MDYEKAYKEALERAKEFMTNKGVAPNADAFKTAKELTETIFPELKESEDEKMIKSIKDAVEYYWSDDTQAKNDIISWLEKFWPKFKNG